MEGKINFREKYDDLSDVKKRLVRDKFCKDFNVTENTFLRRISELNPTIEDLKYFCTVFDIPVNKAIDSTETIAMPLASLVELKAKETGKEALAKRHGLQKQNV